MVFEFEAMTAEGRVVSDALEAASRNDAAESIRGRGLMLLRLDSRPDDDPGARQTNWWGSRIGGRDLMMFTRQAKMLLESGAAVVPALEAIEQQTSKDAFRRILRQVRGYVEKGGSLTDAFQEQGDLFKPVFCSMVAAGEATATLPHAFRRLSDMSQRQQQVRKAVIGALVYPALLGVLCLNVVAVLIGFVVPRFRSLFDNLNAPLPATTQVMFSISQWAVTYWPILLGGAVGAVAIVISVWRTPACRAWIDERMMRAPLIGNAYRRLVLARVLRVWAAMLNCHVPLLEALRQSRSAVQNVAFQRMLNDVEQSVSSGAGVGRALAQSGLVEPVVASAIATGEANGRLSESVEFVSDWMDEDNTQLIANLTRLAEPLLLSFMGLIVGIVAMALFIPLFDLATAGG